MHSCLHVCHESACENTCLTEFQRHDVLIGSEISVIGVMVCKFPLERSFTIQRFGKNQPEHGVKSLSPMPVPLPVFYMGVQVSPPTFGIAPTTW